MPLIIGLIALALGISLTVAWWSAAFVAALQVLFVVSLLFWGLVLVLVGYSEMKAAREYDEAAHGETANGTSAGNKTTTPTPIESNPAQKETVS